VNQKIFAGSVPTKKCQF